MEQSTYTKISKRIGWKGLAPAYPTKAEALQLWREIAEQESKEAFEKVFTYQRFLPSPEGVEQREVIRVINEAFKEGQRIFQ